VINVEKSYILILPEFLRGPMMEEKNRKEKFNSAKIVFKML
jgi:hypothetical protein